MEEGLVALRWAHASEAADPVIDQLRGPPQLAVTQRRKLRHWRDSDCIYAIASSSSRTRYSSFPTLNRIGVSLFFFSLAMASQRADLYSKKLGELLLKGWTMLGENCPMTGEVPLMRDPKSGRSYSIACGQYTDEMELHSAHVGKESAATEAPSAQPKQAYSPGPLESAYLAMRQSEPTSEGMAQRAAPSPAQEPLPAVAARPTPRAEPPLGSTAPAGEETSMSSDDWSQRMSSLLLKGGNCLSPHNLSHLSPQYLSHLSPQYLPHR